MRALILTLRTIASLALVALAVPFLWATVSGDYYMTVTGVSMKPTYQVGDVLVVQQPTGEELSRVGEPVIVSFTPGNREEQYVHRVHELVPEGAVLKGDGNEVVDPVPVTQDQVLGTPRWVLQGGLATLFRVSESWAARGLVGAVFLVALFVPSRGRTRPRDTAEPGTGSGTGIDTAEPGTGTAEPAVRAEARVPALAGGASGEHRA